MRGGFRQPRGGGGAGGMDPKAMARAMKQLGIQVEEIDDVEEVVIRTRTKDIVIRPAEVSAMVQQGQRTWQVTGEATERPRAAAPAATESIGGAGKTRGAEPPRDDLPAAGPGWEEDVKLVMEQAGVGRAEAEKALREAGGEPAAAIVKLIEG